MIRIKFLLVIILFLSPISLLAESDNSSSEAGLFYSTWGSGVMGGYNYSNEIHIGGSLSTGDTTTKSKGLGTSRVIAIPDEEHTHIELGEATLDMQLPEEEPTCATDLGEPPP